MFREGSSGSPWGSGATASRYEGRVEPGDGPDLPRPGRLGRAVYQRTPFRPGTWARRRRAASPGDTLVTGLGQGPAAASRYESAAQISVMRPDQVNWAVRFALKSTTFTVVPANR